MPLPVLASTDAPEITTRHGEHIAFARRQLGAAAGGDKLGCSLMVVPPGKRSWPLHHHAANEEALYILSGEGTLRLGRERLVLRAGDYVALLPGERNAHQVVNTSSEELRYLCISTMNQPDIVLYPDSGKVALSAGSAPGGPKASRTLTLCLRTDAEVDYWEGEDLPRLPGFSPGPRGRTFAP